MTFCGKCGTKNPDDGMFCFKCGAPLYSEDAAADTESRQSREEEIRREVDEKLRNRGYETYVEDGKVKARPKDDNGESEIVQHLEDHGFKTVQSDGVIYAKPKGNGLKAAAIIVVLVVVAAAAFLVLSNGFGSDDDEDVYAKGDGTFTFTAEEAEVNGYEYTGTMTIVLVDGEMTMFDPDIDRTESGGIHIGGGDIEIIPPSDFQDYFPWGMDPTPPEGIQDANPYLDGFTYTWYSHEYSRGSIEVQAYCFESPDGYTLDVGEDGNVYGVLYEYGDVTLQFIRDGWNYSI